MDVGVVLLYACMRLSVVVFARCFRFWRGVVYLDWGIDRDMFGGVHVDWRNGQ